MQFADLQCIRQDVFTKKKGSLIGCPTNQSLQFCYCTSTCLAVSPLKVISISTCSFFAFSV